jgi:hypothetical protein
VLKANPVAKIWIVTDFGWARIFGRSHRRCPFARFLIALTRPTISVSARTYEQLSRYADSCLISCCDGSTNPVNVPNYKEPPFYLGWCMTTWGQPRHFGCELVTSGFTPNSGRAAATDASDTHRAIGWRNQSANAQRQHEATYADSPKIGCRILGLFGAKDNSATPTVRPTLTEPDLSLQRPLEEGDDVVIEALVKRRAVETRFAGADGRHAGCQLRRARLQKVVVPGVSHDVRLG